MAQNEPCRARDEGEGICLCVSLLRCHKTDSECLEDRGKGDVYMGELVYEVLGFAWVKPFLYLGECECAIQTSLLGQLGAMEGFHYDPSVLWEDEPGRRMLGSQ